MINMEFGLVKKINEQYNEVGPVNICIVGDSVSHGCFGGIEPHYDRDAVYHERLRRMMFEAYPNSMVNVINTAVGGSCASLALEHFDRDVKIHNPDLVIVCFGLNDVGEPFEKSMTWLSGIFDKCRENGFDCIYMTPNMLNTYVDEADTPTQYIGYASVTAKWQTEGRMDTYIEKAKNLCAEKGITVCDCYAEWKKMYEAGEDTTKLLANRINHPLRCMHKLFADKLYETIFGDLSPVGKEKAGDGMIKR